MHRFRLFLLSLALLGPLWGRTAAPAREQAAVDRLVRAAASAPDDAARGEARSDGRIVARIASTVAPRDRAPADPRVRTPLAAEAPANVPLSAGHATAAASTYGPARTPRPDARPYDATAPPALHTSAS